MVRKQPIKRTATKRQQPAKPRTAIPLPTITMHTHTANTPIPSAHLAPPPATPTQYIPLPATPAPSFSPSPIPPLPGTLASHITPQPIQWLWKDHIPLGKLTLLEGQPGIGTSLLSIHLAACVSNLHPLPDGTTSPSTGVVIIAPHDHAAHTILPRLHAFAGDPSHVVLLSSLDDDDFADPHDDPFTLSEDLDDLELAIRRIGAALVIIDPITTVFHGNPASQRTLLTSLTQLAHRTNCAILLIRPTTTRTITNTRSLYPGGSLNLLSAIRSSLLLAPDPDDEKQTLLLTTKHSYSAKPKPLIFAISASDQGQPLIDWRGERQQPLISPQQAQSLHRQRILTQLQHSDTSLDAHSLSNDTHQDYEATRKMLQRLFKSGHLVSPARGFYTLPGHPSLSDIPSQPDPYGRDSSRPVPNVPSAAPKNDVPSVPTVPIAYGSDSSHPVSSVPNADIVTLESTLPILPNVPNATAYNPNTYGRDSSHPVPPSDVIQTPSSRPPADVATPASPSTLPTLPILPNAIPNTNRHDTSVYST